MTFRRYFGVLLLALTGAIAQGAPAKPSPAADQAVMISRASIERALGPAPKTGIKDAALSVVPVSKGLNLGVFAIRRTLVNGKPVPDAFQHHDVAEIYQVLSGSGTLVTGGTLERATEMPADSSDVVRLMGPTAAGVAISGGTSQQIGPGDVVIIPANVPHGFTEIGPAGISYLLYRIDPHGVLQPR